jgi:serine/threonine-protein kinase
VSLSAGSRLGPHEILGLLGAGGMGEVYRAHDTKLNRQVAIKVLPEPYASDPDRAARFHREAQAVAALNHPNIAAIYDLAESGGTKFLVLELVEGDTLADRLKSGALPPEEALAVVRQILEALEAAHERGICHRDLKPANVKLTADGTVKVLDFGLAKFIQSGVTAGSNLSLSPTLSVAGTYPGVILGTAGYMSPEQAKGFEADHRSDIFSIGCILYELLSGRQPFEGDTAAEILAAVLKLDVDWTALPPRLNPRLVETLRRCLEKSPKKRWHAAADVRVEIETLMGRAIVVEEPRVEAPAAPRPLWKRVAPVAAGVLAGGLAVGAAMWTMSSEPTTAIARFNVPLPEGQAFTNTGRQVVALSPDGSTLVYVANSQLYRRSMSELDARPIPGSDTVGPVLNPVFSPDGQSIAFFAANDATLKRIAVGGGAPVTICAAQIVYGMSWDDTGIVFGQLEKGILRVSSDGGVPELIAPVETGQIASLPQMLPGGRALLFSLKRVSESWETGGQIVVQVLGGARKTLVEGGADGRYLPTGHLVYARAGILLAEPFDLDRLALTGGPVPVVEGVRRAGTMGPGATGTAQFAVAARGALAYLSGPTVLAEGGDSRALALFDRSGERRALKAPMGSYRSPRASPDGRFVAFDVEDENGVAVWVLDVSGATAMRRLTFGGTSRSPVWSPDGVWIAFQTDREGDLAIFRQRADGSGPAERMSRPEKGVAHIPQSWSPDGAHLLFTEHTEQQSSLSILSLKDQKAAGFSDVRGIELTEGAFSPDGGWIAYQVRESGGNRQVFIQPFPATGAKYLVRAGGHPYWTPKGEALILNVGPTRNELVPVTTTPRVAFGQPVEVSRRGRIEGNPASSRRNADSMPDGTHIIGLSPINPAESSSTEDLPNTIVVVLNWLDEMKRRVPVPQSPGPRSGGRGVRPTARAWTRSRGRAGPADDPRPACWPRGPAVR